MLLRKHSVIALILTTAITATAFADDVVTTKDDNPFSGGAEGNLNLSMGNTDIRTYGASVFGDYKGEVFTTRGKFNYMQNNTGGVERALRYYGSLRTGFNVTNNLDFFALGTYLHNNFQGIDDQWMVTPGLSLYAVNNDDVSIRFEFGAGWMKESYFPTVLGSRSFGLATGGIGLRLKLTDVADFTDDLLYQLPFSQTSDWRLNNIFAITTAMSKHLALKLSYTIEHRAIPVAFYNDTDSFSTASLVVKF